MDMRELFYDILTAETKAEEAAAFAAEQELAVVKAKSSLGLVGPVEVALAADAVDYWYEAATIRLLRFRRWIAAPAEA